MKPKRIEPWTRWVLVHRNGEQAWHVLFDTYRDAADALRAYRLETPYGWRGVRVARGEFRLVQS